MTVMAIKTDYDRLAADLAVSDAGQHHLDRT